MGIFEQGTKLKLRYDHKGSCDTEDLWDLSLTALDSIFKKLNAENKTENEESLLNTKNPENEITELQIAIVRHIVKFKLEEKEAKENAKIKADRKKELLRLIAEKQNEVERGRSIEDLTKMLDEL